MAPSAKASRAQARTARHASVAPALKPLRDVSRTFIPPDADAEELAAFRPQSGVASRVSVEAGRRRLTDAALASAKARQQAHVEPVIEMDEGEGEGKNENEGEADAPFTEQEIQHAEELLERLPALEALEELGKTRVTKVDATPTPAPNPVSLALLSIADGDRLWDWIRADNDHGQTLFGRVMASSLELHLALRQIDASGVALIRTIFVQGRPIGVVELNPMLAAEGAAIVTVYLAPDARAHLAELLPFVVDAASQLTSYHLSFPAPSPEWADLYRRVLAPLGFVEHRMFVR